MNISRISAYQSYQKMEKHISESKASVGIQKENRDQLQISSSAPFEFDRAVRSISEELDAPAPSERIETLRSAVANQTYYVPTDRLVNAILARGGF